MQQEFKPVAIGGSDRARAVKLAETIAEQDYGVADMFVKGRQGERNKVRYKDQKVGNWGQVNGAAISNEMLNQAIAIGRQTRLANGGVDGIDTIKAGPDLIKISKERCMKIW
jgi:hypothetical protein